MEITWDYGGTMADPQRAGARPLTPEELTQFVVIGNRVQQIIPDIFTDFTSGRTQISFFRIDQEGPAASTIETDTDVVRIFIFNTGLRDEASLEFSIFHEILHNSTMINQIVSDLYNGPLFNTLTSLNSSLLSSELIGNPLKANSQSIEEEILDALEHLVIRELVRDYDDVAQYINLSGFNEFGPGSEIVDIEAQPAIDYFVTDLIQDLSLQLNGVSSTQIDNAAAIADWIERGFWVPPNDGLVDDSFLEECFLAGTMISMADGSEKPIEKIAVGDWVTSIDEDGNKVRGRVSRTMSNESKIILDFHGTLVTPGHVYYCAGGKFEGDYAPLIDILRDDGVVQLEDGTPIRAATGCKVGSDEDAEIWALAVEADAKGVAREKSRKKLRLGTRFVIQDGSSLSVFEDLRKMGMRPCADGFVEHVSTGQRMLYQWPVAGQLPPNPEDYVLARSGTTLEDIYRAGEWEALRPQMPAPMIRDGGEVRPVSARTLEATPRNVPMVARTSSAATPADSSPLLNRKARKAREAKQRAAAKRQGATVH